MSRRLFLVGVAVLAVARLAAAWPLSRPDIRFLQSDGPSYLFLAQALVTGHGYTDIFLAEPAPHTRLAPGFPLLIAPLVHPDHPASSVSNIKLLLHLCALASGFAFIGVLRRLGFSRGVSLLAVALFLLAPIGLGQSNDLLPQPPEGLAFALVVLLLTRAGESRGQEDRELKAPTAGRAALAGLLLAACVMLRMADLALWAGAVGFIVLGSAPVKQRLASAAALSAAPAAAVGAWVVRNLLVGSRTGTDYLAVWLGRDASLEAVEPLGLAALFARIGHNALEYLGHAGRLTAADANTGLPIAVLLGLGAAALALVVVGARTPGRAGRVMACFGLPMLAECLLWPFPFIHYFYPLYPLFWAAMATGAAVVAGWAAARLSRGGRKPWHPVAAGVGAVAWLGVAFLPWLSFHPRVEKVSPHLWLRFDTPGAEAVYRLSRAAFASVPKAGHILTHSPMHVALITGPVVSDLPMLPPGEMLEFIRDRRITQLMVDPVFPRTGRYLVPVVLAHPDRFEKMDGIMPRPYGLYRVR